MECAICISTIHTPQFIAPNLSAEKPDDKIDDLDASCLRLGCGHAFHIICITSGFRRGIGCPTCRETLSSNPGLTLNSAGMGGIEFVIEEAEEEIEEDETTSNMYLIMDTKRAQMRTNNRAIKESRRALNEQLRSYKHLAESLRLERRNVIREALKPFALERKNKFNFQYTAVHNALQKVMEVEKREMIKIGNDIAEYSEEYFKRVKLSDYNSKELMRSEDYRAPVHHDPMHPKFWK